MNKTEEHMKKFTECSDEWFRLIETGACNADISKKRLELVEIMDNPP